MVAYVIAVVPIVWVSRSIFINRISLSSNFIFCSEINLFLFLFLFFLFLFYQYLYSAQQCNVCQLQSLIVQEHFPSSPATVQQPSLFLPPSSFRFLLSFLPSFNLCPFLFLPSFLSYPSFLAYPFIPYYPSISSYPSFPSTPSILFIPPFLARLLPVQHLLSLLYGTPPYIRNPSLFLPSPPFLLIRPFYPFILFLSLFLPLLPLFPFVFPSSPSFLSYLSFYSYPFFTSTSLFSSFLPYPLSLPHLSSFSFFSFFSFFPSYLPPLTFHSPLIHFVYLSSRSISLSLHRSLSSPPPHSLSPYRKFSFNLIHFLHFLPSFFLAFLSLLPPPYLSPLFPPSRGAPNSAKIWWGGGGGGLQR